MSKEIYFDAPNVGSEEKKYLNDAIDSGYVSTVGPLVSEFESKFAAYLNMEGAASTQSGTAAIHLALYELGIGKGDEVIVPALTFIATVNPVLYVGATPVFADVEKDTWNISPDEIERLVTPKTKAIIPVHLYGNPCDMDAIKEIAEKRGIAVIEDATESLGAIYKGRHTGTLGDFGCFSFNGNKIITTGGGGMVVGKDTKRLDHIKFLVNQARDKSKGYYHPEVGFNDRMTNIEAALGLAQFNRLDEFLEKKRSFNKIYREELKEVEEISFQKECEASRGSYWLNCILVKDSVSLQEQLKRRGVDNRAIFIPITEFPPYQGVKRLDYENSYYIWRHGLCLPSSTLNTEENIRYVCKILKEIIL